MADIQLASNQYGKAENRVVRVTRDTDRHEVDDLNVTSQLRGDFDAAHTDGRQRPRRRRPTPRRTRSSRSPRTAFDSPEAVPAAARRPLHLRVRLGQRAAAGRPRSTGGPRIERARPRLLPGRARRSAPRSLVRDGGPTPRDRRASKDLTVLNSTNSEFWGYVKDRYTTLKGGVRTASSRPTSPRQVALQLDQRRRAHAELGEVLRADAQAKTCSPRPSRRRTPSRSSRPCDQMGSHAVIDNRSEIDEIRFSCRNNHHFLVGPGAPSASRTTTRSTSRPTARTVSSRRPSSAPVRRPPTPPRNGIAGFC